MKKWICSCFAGCALLSLAPMQAYGNTNPISYIEVQGEGEVKVVPDQVLIRIGIETFGPRLKNVRQDISDRTLALMNVLRSLGIKREDIQSEMVQINPHYDFDKAKRRFIEYTARKNFLITIRKIDDYGAVLEGALESGVEYLHGIDFQTSQMKNLQDKALKLAVLNAKEKAGLMASSIGQSIGKAQIIREIPTGKPYPVMMKAAALDNLRGGGVKDIVAPGEITVQSSVQVQFDLK